MGDEAPRCWDRDDTFLVRFYTDHYNSLINYCLRAQFPRLLHGADPCVTVAEDAVQTLFEWMLTEWEHLKHLEEDALWSEAWKVLRYAVWCLTKVERGTLSDPMSLDKPVEGHEDLLLSGSRLIGQISPSAEQVYFRLLRQRGEDGFLDSAMRGLTPLQRRVVEQVVCEDKAVLDIALDNHLTALQVKDAFQTASTVMARNLVLDDLVPHETQQRKIAAFLHRQPRRARARGGNENRHTSFVAELAGQCDNERGHL
jgi:hypothetical protein